MRYAQGIICSSVTHAACVAHVATTCITLLKNHGSPHAADIARLPGCHLNFDDGEVKRICIRVFAVWDVLLGDNATAWTCIHMGQSGRVASFSFFAESGGAAHMHCRCVNYA